MTLWSAILLLVFFCSSGFCQNLDDLIDDVFKKPFTEANVSQQQNSTSAPDFNLQPNIGGEDVGIPGTGDCTCVAYYLCYDGTTNRNGEGIIDIRIIDGQCGTNYLQICCSPEDRRTEPLPTQKLPIKPSPGCGYRHTEGVGFRITGDKDNEAQFGEFPWMVAILREEYVEENSLKVIVYQCGGALIHPQAVITAAHCVAGKDTNFIVRAGEWDTQNMDELYPHQDRDVQSIIVHPQYLSGVLYNDVAILILKSPVDSAENIGTVCLPSQEDIVESGRCFATGWGKDVFGKMGKYQVILKKINLSIVPNPQCQDTLRTSRLGRFFELHPSFICAGGELNKDTCEGDGGSPLVCPVAGSTNRYFQAGIVAWGIGCGENHTPGVYANVAKFRTWIDEQMTIHGLDTLSYQN